MNDQKGNTPIILRLSPDALDVIPEVVTFMENSGMPNLEELLAYGVPELLQMPGFNRRCLRSIYKLLRRYECEGLLHDAPKRKHNYPNDDLQDL